MEIRKATMNDYFSICRSLQNKKINYQTPAHAKSDIQNQSMFILVDNGKILAQCSLIEEPDYFYTAIKRLCIYNKKNYGKGIADMFIKYFVSNTQTPLGCTPWEDNAAMRHLLEKNGFIYQYTFLNYYCFYKRG